MADKWPLANGNWSDAANWNDGVKPGVGDDVFADGKTIAIDEPPVVASLRNTPRTGGSSGGGFTLNSGVVNQLVGDMHCGPATLVSQTGGAWSIIGSVFGPSSAGVAGIACVGFLELTGNVTQGTSGHAIDANAAGCRIIGNLFAENNASHFGQPQSCVRVRTAVVEIIGNVTSLVTTAGACIYVSSGNAVVTIIGDIYSGTLPAIRGDNLSAIVFQHGGNVTGVDPVHCYNFPIVHRRHSTIPSILEFRTYDVASTRSFYTGGINLGQPVESDVRLGTAFGASGEYTGTLAVPAPEYVSSGIPVDNTVGTLTTNSRLLALENTITQLDASVVNLINSAAYYPVERSTTDTNPITFTWPVADATITVTKSINNSDPYTPTVGTVSFLRLEDGKQRYSLSFNAADRPTEEGVVRYRFTDGTYTKYLNMRVVSVATLEDIATNVRAEMDTNSTKLTNILEDTGTTLPAVISDIGTAVDAILVDTGTNIPTVLNDMPTTAEFEARTLPSDSYFDPATDTVARVTLVDTVTVNTDMVNINGITTELAKVPKAGETHRYTQIDSDVENKTADVAISVTP